ADEGLTRPLALLGSAYPQSSLSRLYWQARLLQALLQRPALFDITVLLFNHELFCSETGITRNHVHTLVAIRAQHTITGPGVIGLPESRTRAQRKGPRPVVKTAGESRLVHSRKAVLSDAGAPVSRYVVHSREPLVVL